MKLSWVCHSHSYSCVFIMNVLNFDARIQCENLIQHIVIFIYHSYIHTHMHTDNMSYSITESFPFDDEFAEFLSCFKLSCKSYSFDEQKKRLHQIISITELTFICIPFIYDPKKEKRWGK